MDSLVILTTQQMSDYIAGLNLAQGTEAYNTLNTMLLLPSQTFVRAISAVAAGLVAFSDLRSLPAMNAGLVNSLINGRLADSDLGALTYKYANLWVPASINVLVLQASSMGSVSTYLAARLFDFWGAIIQPTYDFTGANQKAYSSYGEAYAAYISAVNVAESTEAVAAFQVAHNSLRSAYPSLLQSTDAECPILQAILGLLTNAYFLERPGGGKAPNEILDLVASATYRFVTPTLYKQFMENVAYPAMAAAADSDTSNTGAPGAAAVAASQANGWGPLPSAGVEWALDLPRMALIWLPAAYGFLVLDEGQLADGYAKQTALLNYLDAAREALMAVRNAVFANFPIDASNSSQTGTPVGILLTITNP
jgi:hypothetical protein